MMSRESRFLVWHVDVSFSLTYFFFHKIIDKIAQLVDKKHKV